MISNKGLGGFKKTFGNMISDRLDDIGSEFIITDQEYKKSSDKSTELHNTIKENLPKEYKCLINAYEEEMTYQMLISEKAIYEQGLKDGVELNNMIFK